MPWLNNFISCNWVFPENFVKIGKMNEGGVRVSESTGRTQTQTMEGWDIWEKTGPIVAIIVNNMQTENLPSAT